MPVVFFGVPQLGVQSQFGALEVKLQNLVVDLSIYEEEARVHSVGFAHIGSIAKDVVPPGFRAHVCTPETSMKFGPRILPYLREHISQYLSPYFFWKGEEVGAQRSWV